MRRLEVDDLRQRRHGGAALIVVISLLGTLAFLGFLFYSFAAQELASAEFFSQSATPNVPQPPDVYFDWALEQLIVGTDASLSNSALYGNKYSLIANAIGTPNPDYIPVTPFPNFGSTSDTPDDLDLTWGVNAKSRSLQPWELPYADVQPFDGAGITPVVTDLADTTAPSSPLKFGFDINQNGVFDGAGTEPTWENFIMNFSPAADFATGTAFSGSAFYRDYEPDAGYTYPDINSLFLGYDTTVRGWRGGTPSEYRVIIPSFFRPQLFPARRGANVGNTVNGTKDWGFSDLDNDGDFTDGLYTDPQTARQVLRPHVAHIASFAPLVRRYVPPPLPAYIGELDGDADGDGNMDSIIAKSGDTNRLIRPFPFFVDLDGDGVPNEMGVWTNPNQGRVGGTVNYELDVDADGDGVRDAIWMDFDYPMMTLDDGRQFVPMMGIKIVDADALVNVNAHGNSSGLYVRLQDGSIHVVGPDATAIAGASGMAEGISFHQSNLGLSPAEVNLSLALTADLRVEDTSNPGQPDRDLNPVDPKAADPRSVASVEDLVATQFDVALNFGYAPTAAYSPAELSSPSAAALSNLEALMILNGRREFERLRDGSIRETRQQVLGRHADRFKIVELYQRLASGGLSDDEDIPGPLPGGYYLDDDGDSNKPELAREFGGPVVAGVAVGDDDIDAPGVSTSNFKRGGGSYFYDDDLHGVQLPPAVHPLDYLGAGSGIYDRTPTAGVYLTRQLNGGPLTALNNPSVFPTYLDQVGAALGLPNVPLNYWHFNGDAQDARDNIPPFDEVDLTGVRPWWRGLSTVAATPTYELQQYNRFYDFLIDEPNEVILEPELRNPEYDAVFPTYEMEALHLSSSDFTKVKGSSRLQDLASVNLKRVRDSVRATISKRLTTDSWDRLEPGQTRYQSSPGAGFDRTWEYTEWVNGIIFPPAVGPQPFRTDANIGTFPPAYDPANTNNAAPGQARDPFRPDTRLLLKNERGFSGNITGEERYPRRKLNLNRILCGELPMGAPAPPVGSIDRRAFDVNKNPRFRNLTPHANPVELLKQGAIDTVTIPNIDHRNFNPRNFTNGNGDHAQGNAPPFADLGLDPISGTSTNRRDLVEAQEWWARYDRQRLARDIYVLLYTLGAGGDAFNPTATPSTYYTHSGVPAEHGDPAVDDRVEAMAQFAVNYVDALDHDNVITKFDYDKDLSDGWQWANGDSYVNGVEAQQLTFSEVVWTRTADPPPTSDEPATAWDDTDQHQFLHIELRSTSPFPIELGNDSYRIVRVENDAQAFTDTANRSAAVQFKRDASGLALTVPPGEVFTIGTTDGVLTGGLDVADMYVDDGAGMWDCIVPKGSAKVADPADVNLNPKTDLDLVSSKIKPAEGSTTYAAYSEYFTLLSGPNRPDAGGNGLTNLVGVAPPAVDSVGDFYLVLERRRNMQDDAVLGQTDGPGPNPRIGVWEDWIEVDRILVTANTDFDPTDLQASLEAIRSDYRVEPLSAPQDFMTSPRTQNSTMARGSHSIEDYWDATLTGENPFRHGRNLADPGAFTPPTPPAPDPRLTPFTIWQPHFDRDFSSIFELFAVPLFGPSELTRRLADVNGKVSGYDKTPPPPLPAPQVERPSLAGRLFTDTDPLDDTDAGAGTGIADDNRWYRLLEYVEIPDRAEDAIRERLVELIRTPGKLNLNTLRDEPVLAALLDDPFIERFGDANLDRMTDSDVGLEDESDGIRNWMDELRLARDGVDPVNYLADGTPANQTFLPLPGIPGVVGDVSDTGSGLYGATGGRPQFGALPFRALSYLDPNRSANVATNGGAASTTFVDPTVHTILRKNIGQVGNAADMEVIPRKPNIENLGLFEARPTSDDDGTAPDDDYDYHTRNRLLAKVANNSTERSNVFVCWIVVEYFEAHQPDPVGNPGIVQVGAKLEGSPTHRGFFVIDRTRLERAVDKDSISNDDNNGENDTFRFDWRDFVIHRRTVQ